MGFGVFAVREYIQVHLIDSLTTGVAYKVSFFISPADIYKYSIDQVGIYFSNAPPVACSPAGCVLNCIPQVSNATGNVITDTLNWTEITGTFTASGGEKYITIGNFKSDSLTQTAIINNTSSYPAAYFYIDDVSVYPDSITNVEDVKVSNSKFQIYPNPNNGRFILEFDAIEKDALMEIKNVFGQIVYSDKFLNINDKQSKTIDLSILPNGVYFISVQSSMQRINQKFVKE